ncbi:MAG: hypothetical protein ACI865_001002 [Flavobacteriaceae bacterium]|jgi:hypothetical protein
MGIPMLASQKIQILNKERDFWMGTVILVAMLVGFIVRIVKVREVANCRTGAMSFFENLFLGLLLIFGINVSLNLTMISCIYFFGATDTDNATVYIVSLMSISILILFYEAVKIFAPNSFKSSITRKKWLNPFYTYYVGMGIALSWDISIVGGSSGLSYAMHNFWSEFTANIFLALMMVVSVQRLFWFEVFINSAGWKDNLKVFASLILVIASAVVPLFFI